MSQLNSSVWVSLSLSLSLSLSACRPYLSRYQRAEPFKSRNVHPASKRLGIGPVPHNALNNVKKETPRRRNFVMSPSPPLPSPPREGEAAELESNREVSKPRRGNSSR